MVGLVQFGRFGLTCLVWQVWFGLGNGYNLTWPMVPLEVVIASLELNLGTIPGRVGSVLVGSVRSNSDYKAISVQLQLQLPAGTELGKNPDLYTTQSHLLRVVGVARSSR